MAKRMGEGTTGVVPVVARVCGERALGARTSVGREASPQSSSPLRIMPSGSLTCSLNRRELSDQLRTRVSDTSPCAASALGEPTPMK